MRLKLTGWGARWGICCRVAGLDSARCCLPAVLPIRSQPYCLWSLLPVVVECDQFPLNEIE